MKSIDKLKEFLKDNGWHTWYNENYWCHPEIVEDCLGQDYTNYGMSLKNAIVSELGGRSKMSAFYILGMRAFS